MSALSVIPFSIRPIRAIVLTLGLILLPACGGDDDPASPSGPRAVSGTVTKGPVADAALSIHVIGADGSLGEAVAGPYITDASGAWSGEFPAGRQGPFLLVATGGSYTDEATGGSVDLGTEQMLSYSAKGSGQVTPYTHTLSIAAAAQIGAGSTSPSEAWTNVIATFQAAFGFDPTTTRPSLSGTESQRTYLALLGGLSELLDGNAALSGLAGAEPIDLVLALVADLSDGALDGLDASGGALSIDTGSGTVLWPSLDPTGLGVLVDAINAFAAGVTELQDIVLGQVDLDFGGGSTGEGSGSVTFSGSGVGLVAINPFAPQGFSANESSLAWAGATAGGAVSIGVSKSPFDATRATLLSVSSAPGGGVGYGWSIFVFEQGESIPGVSISGNTVTFSDVVVPGTANTDQSVTMNGTLGP